MFGTEAVLDRLIDGELRSPVASGVPPAVLGVTPAFRGGWIRDRGGPWATPDVTPAVNTGGTGSGFVLDSESPPLLITELPPPHGSESALPRVAAFKSSKSALPVSVPLRHAVDATDGDLAVVEDATLAPRPAPPSERPVRFASFERRGMPDAQAIVLRVFRCAASATFFGLDRRFKVDRVLRAAAVRGAAVSVEVAGAADAPPAVVRPADVRDPVGGPVGAAGPLDGREKVFDAVVREVPVGVMDLEEPPRERVASTRETVSFGTASYRGCTANYCHCY